MQQSNLKSINSFTKGLNQDTDISILSKDSYIDANNFRLVTGQGQSTTALEVIDGNTKIGEILTGYKIVGYTTIRNTIVFFTTNRETQSSTGNSIIYKATVDNGSYSSFSIVYSDTISPDGSLLNLSQDYPVKAIGRYESDGIIKVYWTDNYNKLRFINIADTNVQSYPTTKFDVSPVLLEGNITINSLGNGSLSSGSVQYAYQLYNLYGAETRYSSLSKVIPLTSYSSTGADYGFTGDKSGAVSGKSVKLTVSNVDTDFDRIRIVRLFYSTLTSVPIITIIDEATTESSISFIDLGTQDLGTLTLEQFEFINYDFNCKEIETKDNILFAADITENVWDIDWDARAYRFISATHPEVPYRRKCYLRSGSFNGSYIVLDGATPSGWDIDPAHDAINNFNEIINYESNYKFIYQADGTTLGGSGLNVSYKFITKSSLIDANLSLPVVNTNSVTNSYTSSIYADDLKGYQRDEIYPFAIILYNDKGRASYAKWIGDIRFPTIYQSNVGRSFSSDATAYVQGIEFTISNLPSDCIGYKIVRCKREEKDRTVYAQGMISMSRMFNTFYTPYVTMSTIFDYNHSYPRTAPRAITGRGDWHNIVGNLLEFVSPDVIYNKKLPYAGGDFLELVDLRKKDAGFFKGNVSDSSYSVCDLNIDYNYNNASVIWKPYGGSPVLTSLVNPATVGTRVNVNDTAVVSPIDQWPEDDGVLPGAITIDGKQYENYNRRFEDAQIQGKHATHAVIATASEFDVSSIADWNNTYQFGRLLMVCNYRKNTIPYGGNTYNSRSNRKYIDCSGFIPSTTSVSSIYRGDTYITNFEYLRTMNSSLIGENKTDAEENFNETFITYLESSIDTRWQYNKTFTQESISGLTRNVSNGNAWFMQETAGIHAKYSYSFTQEYPLYSYNSVYSLENGLVTYIPKPIDLNTNYKFDNRVIHSGVKINNEISDNWTSFKTTNFLDVDSTKGSIHSLKLFNNQLYFWQDKGFGVLSVNQRTLLSDNNPGSLLLGTGGVLTRCDYISSELGNISQYGVVTGVDGLYWYDTVNSTFCKYSRSLETISKVKGVQSWINGFANKTTICKGVYDYKYIECIFTLDNGTNEYTIAFNELIDAFTSKYSYTPNMYFQHFDGTYASTNDSNSIWLHNSGNKSTFYTTTYPSSIKLLVNDDYHDTKVYDNIEYTSISNNGIINLFNDTFDTISVNTTKQYTGVVDIESNTSSTTCNTNKRENNFVTVIPRNIVNKSLGYDVNMYNTSNQDVNRLYKERIRDKYAMIELTYNNSNNYRFSVPYVITNYRISKR